MSSPMQSDDWMSKGHAQFPMSDSHRSNPEKWSIGILIASTITVSLRPFKTRVPCESARTMKQMSSSTDRRAADL